MDKIITIVGPTASGKTSLAIQLSKELGSEVISLDSRQIYKGMGMGLHNQHSKKWGILSTI